jgi:hypothetical protein
MHNANAPAQVVEAIAGQPVEPDTQAETVLPPLDDYLPYPGGQPSQTAMDATPASDPYTPISDSYEGDPSLPVDYNNYPDTYGNQLGGYTGASSFDFSQTQFEPSYYGGGSEYGGGFESAIEGGGGVAGGEGGYL